MIKKISILCSLLVTITGTVSADYNVSSYDVAYTPYNLQAAIGHGNCDNEIEAFDQVYKEMRVKLREGYNPGPGATMASAARMQANWYDEIERALINNDLDTEDLLADCLRGQTKAEENNRELREQERADNREEEIRMGLAQCDLELIEDLDEEEKRDYADKLKPCVDARTAVIEAAVMICDFSFFENEMTRNELNSWFLERKKCEENPPAVALLPETDVVPINTVPPSVDIPVSPVEQTVEDIETSEILDGGELVEIIDTSAEGQVEATTTEELIEVTPDELDRLVEQRMAEQQEQQSQAEETVESTESKPAFFRRVVNFFFGWF